MSDPDRSMPDRSMTASAERPATSFNGYMMLVLLLAIPALFVWLVSGPPPADPSIGQKLAFVGTIVVCILGFVLVLGGFYMIQPNQGIVVTLFGDYRGTDRRAGLHWIWPWMGRKKISVRANNIISDKIKVNDLRGNPIEMAAQVVWRVADTAQAMFDVDDYKSFVVVQI